MGKITKERAAEILGARNVRTVERHAASGRLSVTYEPGKTRRVPLFDEDEVRRLKADLDGQTPAARPAISPPAGIATRGDNSDTRASLSQQREELSASAVSIREQLTRVAVALEDLNHECPMVTIREAAELTGASPDVLRGAVREGKLQHFKGRGWGRSGKVKIADVRYFLNFEL